MDDVSLDQMTIYKACKVDFPEYNETVCENLVSDYKDENELVQEEVRKTLQDTYTKSQKKESRLHA